MLIHFMNGLNALGEMGADIRDEIKKLDTANTETQNKVKAALNNLSDAALAHAVTAKTAHDSALNFHVLVERTQELLNETFKAHGANLQFITGDLILPTKQENLTEDNTGRAVKFTEDMAVGETKTDEVKGTEVKVAEVKQTEGTLQ